jgi:hypothetical protein
MGTNPNDNIFGIMIYTFNDDNVKLLYRKENEEKMSKEEMREAYLFYTKLNDKNDVQIKIYTEISSTLNLVNDKNFMMWQPIQLSQFLQIFRNLDP